MKKIRKEKKTARDHFVILIREIRLLREILRNNTKMIRSVIIPLLAKRNKEIDFLKTQVGV
ncbi:MAG: hypothetical protein WC673_01660 [Candidatus Paceibacterota bacterium]|jgi:hypothetical protein